MNNAIFAFDFSCNKPAMTSYINNVIEFYIWPSDIDSKSYDKFISSYMVILKIVYFCVKRFLFTKKQILKLMQKIHRWHRIDL